MQYRADIFISSEALKSAMFTMPPPPPPPPLLISVPRKGIGRVGVEFLFLLTLA